MKLATSEQVRRIDAAAIERFGLPGAALMETAGGFAAREVLRVWSARSRRGVAVLAGKGNNGGDGFVLARHLMAAGRKTTVLLVGARVETLKGDARRMAEVFASSGGRIVEEATPKLVEDAGSRAGVVVDGLLGTGSTGAPLGPIALAIEALERARARSGDKRARVLALDIPSGVDASSGEVPGCVVQADRTVTFGLPKVGLYTHPATRYAGKVVVAPLGWPKAAWEGEAFRAETLAGPNMKRLVPVLDTEAHKGDRGRVLVVAGSDHRPGAAALCCYAAFRTGAGLVTVATTAMAGAEVLSVVPEAMVESLAASSGELAASAAGGVAELALKADAVAIGPGLGVGPGPMAVLAAVLATGKPVIVDADGISLLAANGLSAPHAVVTPHPGEMGRLAGVDSTEIQARRLHFATGMAGRFGVVVLKGARTLVADSSGGLGINLTGNPGLATAGAGDVLSGMVAALLARGLEASAAARVAVWAHGVAADQAAVEIAGAGFLARDVADRVGRVLQR